MAGRCSVSNNRNPDFGDAVDAAGDFVAAVDGADTGGRPGHDQIARHQLEQLRQMGDRFRYAPDLLRQIAVLTDFAVDSQPDAAAIRMADIGGRNDRRARRRVIEGLSGLPGGGSVVIRP